MAQSQGGADPYLLTPADGPAVADVVFVAIGQNDCGRLVAVWIRQPDSGASSVLETSYSDDGVKWSVPQNLLAGDELSDAGELDGYPPAIGIDGSGKILAVWSASTEEQAVAHLRFSTSEDAGMTWSVAADIVADIPDYVTKDVGPAVLGRAAGGFVVAWVRQGFFPQDQATGTTAHAFVTSTDPAGAWRSAEFLHPLDQADPHIAEVMTSLVELGDATVLAVSDRATVRDDQAVLGLVFGRSEDGGASWHDYSASLPPVDADVTRGPEWPQVAVDRNTGRLLLAWNDYFNVYTSVSDDNGISWSAPIRMYTDDVGRGNDPSLSAHHVAWRSNLGWVVTRLAHDDATDKYLAQAMFSEDGLTWPSHWHNTGEHAPFSLYAACASEDRWLIYGTTHEVAGGTVSNPIVLAAASPEMTDEQPATGCPLCGLSGIELWAVGLAMLSVQALRTRLWL
jgi:hypothetical protein